MTDRIRFHLDENMHSAVAIGLRRRGVDVTTTAEVGLIGYSDEEQLEFALREGRMLITQDNDFLRLHAQGSLHAGIAYYKPGTRSIGHILRSLIVIYDSMTHDEVMGQVLFL